jgi:hypothetical protein
MICLRLWRLQLAHLPLLLLRQLQQKSWMSQSATRRLPVRPVEMGPPDNPPARRVVVEALTLEDMSGVKLAEWSDIQSGRVVLDIGGTRFITSNTTLRADSGSLLCAMVRQGSPMRPWKVEDGNPVYFLDRDPAHF